MIPYANGHVFWNTDRRRNGVDAYSATLRIKVGETPYQLRFEEHIDGRWKLMDFEDRQAFSERAIKRMKPHHFMILARL